MRTFDSLASTNAEPPSERSYGSIARYVARRRGLAVLALAGVPLALQVAGGQYAVAALVAGTLTGCAAALVAGVAVSFDDARVGVAATATTAVVLAATGVAARALAFGDAGVLGIVLALIVVPGALAAGLVGYSVAERAR